MNTKSKMYKHECKKPGHGLEPCVCSSSKGQGPKDVMDHYCYFDLRDYAYSSRKPFHFRGRRLLKAELVSMPRV